MVFTQSSVSWGCLLPHYFPESSLSLSLLAIDFFLTDKWMLLHSAQKIISTSSRPNRYA